MYDPKENKLTLLTKFNQYRVIHSYEDKLTGGIIEESLNLREKATIDALIQLGWNPPEDTKNLEVLTSIVLEIARGEYEGNEMSICAAYFEDRGVEIE